MLVNDMMACSTLKVITESGNKVSYIFMSLDLNTRIQREVLGAKVYRKCRMILMSQAQLRQESVSLKICQQRFAKFSCKKKKNNRTEKINNKGVTWYCRRTLNCLTYVQLKHSLANCQSHKIPNSFKVKPCKIGEITKRSSYPWSD